MSTNNTWLTEAITQTITTLTEEAKSGSTAQRPEYEACVEVLHNLRDLVERKDRAPIFTMHDLIDQIEADLATQPQASDDIPAERPAEVLIKRLNAWITTALRTEPLEVPR